MALAGRDPERVTGGDRPRAYGSARPDAPRMRSVARSAADSGIIAEYTGKPADDGAAPALAVDGLGRAISQSCADEATLEIAVDGGARGTARDQGGCGEERVDGFHDGLLRWPAPCRRHCGTRGRRASPPRSARACRCSYGRGRLLSYDRPLPRACYRITSRPRPAIRGVRGFGRCTRGLLFRRPAPPRTHPRPETERRDAGPHL